jgi:flagellar biosynthesis protein
LNILSNTKDSDMRALSGPRADENGTDTVRKEHSRADMVAVALEYDSESEFAPKVVAGGRGKVAEQILQIAFDRGIKVREDADLAEMLSAIDIDSEIPVNAFAAVAEILTYVYQANGNVPDLMKERLHEDSHSNHQNQNNNSSDKPKETS